MHTTPDPRNDAPLPDADTAAPRVTKYVVQHNQHVISPEYDTMSEAELYRLFDTPGTDDYRVRAVHASTPTGETK